MNIDVTISIHALLAESDYSMGRNEKSFRGYFYPRSPCGERLRHNKEKPRQTNFYPRSPCGERHDQHMAANLTALISIHALLAESDNPVADLTSEVSDFYPRSPCGERQDINRRSNHIERFLSTLSLRRAT